MRSFFSSLMLSNQPSLLLLPRLVMPLPILHTLLAHGFSILVHLIICLVIRISSSLTITSPLPMITLANGTQTMAKGIGSSCPLPSLPLTSVLYVPDSPFNIISISKLIHDLNYSTTFSHSFVTLQDRSTGRMIGIGHESQDLYHLSSTLSSTVYTSIDDPLLVHCRLRHSNFSKHWKTVSCFSSLSSLECESCQLGKHTRVSFPKRLESRTKSLFELVHTDVWGLSRTASTLGFWYFVTFIDDFSCCTGLFLMKSRTELFSMFQKFFAEIRNQLHTSIRILCNDNALEYLFAHFSDFLSSHGILHQSSCVYTPQQHGVVERKNRHLVETTCTLLLHHTVPQHFWGNAILTACYLINHMPSSVLGDQVPHSLLFPNQPLFCLPSHVFECTCFVHILTPGQDKLSAKATRCIFLGYSRLQRGYHCYSPDTHRYFVSVDVTFFEHSSLFSTPPPSSSEVLLCLSSFPFCPYHPSPRLLHLVHYRFILVIRSHDDSFPMTPSSTSPILPSPIDPSITIRKGTRSFRNPHPIYAFLSYHCLSSPYFAFISTLSSVSIPHTAHEALSHPRWKQAMVEEMVALHSSGTWDLVPLPVGKSLVGCR